MATQDTEGELNSLPMLGRVPFLVFLIVAGVDGEIDEKELSRFKQLLKQERYAILAALMQRCPQLPTEIFAELSTLDGKQLVAEMYGAGGAINLMLEAEVAQQLKAALNSFAKEIAQASGGLLGIFGSKISKEEQAALDLISSALSIGEESGRNEPGTNVFTAAPDNVFPVLKPAEWIAETRGKCVLHDMYGGNEIEDGEPAVAYAIDSEESIAYINLNQLGEKVSDTTIKEQALQNLRKRLSGASWEEINEEPPIPEIGAVRGLALVGDYYCSEAILLPEIMKKGHELLNSELLAVIVPQRGELFATSLSGDPKLTGGQFHFLRTVMKRFFNSTDRPISSTVWITKNGNLVGHIKGLDELVESAKNAAKQDIERDDEMLLHTTIPLKDGDGESTKLVVTVHSYEVMNRNLQHVVRAALADSCKRPLFSGNISVELAIWDKDNSMSEQQRRDDLVSMFEFLQRQATELFSPAFGKPISITYTATMMSA